MLVGIVAKNVWFIEVGLVKVRHNGKGSWVE